MKTLIRTVFLFALTGPVIAAESEPLSLDGLLDAVRSGRIADSEADAERLRRFTEEQQLREQMLEEIKAEERSLEQKSEAMEKQFEANDLLIGELEDRLRDRMGSLKELFGVLQQVASDAQAQFHVSLTQLEFTERTNFLVDFAGRMGEANRLPELAEIERLWFELQREMVESGRIVTRDQMVLSASGLEETQSVTRIGLFNAVADGRYLRHIPETGRLVEFSRQPDSRYTQGPKALADGEDEVFPIEIGRAHV